MGVGAVTPHLLPRAKAFLSYSDCSDVTRKCNKSIIRCKLKLLTLLPLPSLKFLSYDPTRELKK